MLPENKKPDIWWQAQILTFVPTTQVFGPVIQCVEETRSEEYGCEFKDDVPVLSSIIGQY